MPSVARLTDICTGHGPCRPRVNVTASKDVFVNGLGAHRLGDGWSYHCNHTGILAAGSQTVFANGLELGRVADPVSCGSLVATGSTDVFAGPD